MSECDHIILTPTSHTPSLNTSASLDGKCKIWDVYNERQVKRTYSGHSAAVRCVNFNEDGSRCVRAHALN